MTTETNPLAEKWALWCESYCDTDVHAISNQISIMLWDTAVWRTINNARKHAHDGTSGQHRFNSMTHELIDRGFFESQMLAIRRLADGSYKIDGKKSVISLVSILEAMKKDFSIITRKNILCSEGLPLQTDAIRRKADEYGRDQAKQGKKAYWVPRELHYEPIEARYSQIDKICGVNAGNRTDDDRIDGELLTSLISKTSDAVGTISNHVNKFIAHSATPWDRKKDNDDGKSTEVTLKELCKAQKALCGVASSLGYILQSNYHFEFFPIAQYDQFELIDAPLVRPEDVQTLRDEWDKFGCKTNGWAEIDEKLAGD